MLATMNGMLSSVLETTRDKPALGGSRGAVGPVPPPVILEFFFFFTKTKLTSKKISINRVRNLSQNAGNSHFRDSHFLL